MHECREEIMHWYSDMRMPRRDRFVGTAHPAAASDTGFTRLHRSNWILASDSTASEDSGKARDTGILLGCTLLWKPMGCPE